ncbi:MAG TPA: acyl-ACP desaturase [Aequorivita sp.]|nr:acyl-ACP desaturase [Aequorivita sp.]
MKLKNIRLEVMQTVEKEIDEYIDKYLIPVEKIWQPTDLLPDFQKENYMEEIHQLREEAKELGYDFWVVLVGDMVTEEALPTYESWLMDMEGVDQHGRNGWSKWIRHWTGEENRHGDTLNKYLYLSGRVNMREVEITTHHLINDGFEVGTGRDPYRNFVYTSFQELATNISHKRVAKIAKDKGNKMLSKMCNIIAGDEMRHHIAYRQFVKTIFEYDPSEMMLAFEDMMKKKIIMPAQNLRQSGGKMASAFDDFSNAAQRLGVYTTYDYIEILQKLNDFWEISKMTDLNDEAEKARDYLVKLPSRMLRIAERVKIPEDTNKFKWIQPNGML